jgi:hypothetical protein
MSRKQRRTAALDMERASRFTASTAWAGAVLAREREHHVTGAGAVVAPGDAAGRRERLEAEAVALPGDVGRLRRGLQRLHGRQQIGLEEPPGEQRAVEAGDVEDVRDDRARRGGQRRADLSHVGRGRPLDDEVAVRVTAGDRGRGRVLGAAQAQRPEQAALELLAHEPSGHGLDHQAEEDVVRVRVLVARAGREPRRIGDGHLDERPRRPVVAEVPGEVRREDARVRLVVEQPLVWLSSWSSVMPSPFGTSRRVSAGPRRACPPRRARRAPRASRPAVRPRPRRSGARAPRPPGRPGARALRSASTVVPSPCRAPFRRCDGPSQPGRPAGRRETGRCRGRVTPVRAAPPRARAGRGAPRPSVRRVTAAPP